MEEQNIVTYLSAPDNDANTLFGIYLQISGNSNASLDDFTTFMTADSVERKQFLDINCIYSFIEKEDYIVLKYKLKQLI